MIGETSKLVSSFIKDTMIQILKIIKFYIHIFSSLVLLKLIIQPFKNNHILYRFFRFLVLLKNNDSTNLPAPCMTITKIVVSSYWA